MVTKNLGLVRAIFVGVNPPSNIKILWYDDNLGQKLQKYYDVISATWKPLLSPPSTPLWGGILGNLPDQIDLKNKFDTKANNSDVVHINGPENVLGPKDFAANINANGGIDAVGVLNIGGVTATGINIGYPGLAGPINIFGTIIEEKATSQFVDAKFITLNKGGAVNSGLGVGFKIEENSLITGYILTSATRDGWDLKSPANINKVTLDMSTLTGNVVHTLPNQSGTYALKSDIIAPIHGGTGQTTYNVGDTLYASSTTTLSSVPVGANGTVYTVVAGVPTWQVISGGVTGSGTINRLTKWSTTTGNLIDSQLFDNGSSVSIGTTTSSARFHVVGSGSTFATFTAKFESASNATLLAVQDNGDLSGIGLSYTPSGGGSQMKIVSSMSISGYIQYISGGNFSQWYQTPNNTYISQASGGQAGTITLSGTYPGVDLIATSSAPNVVVSRNVPLNSFDLTGAVLQVSDNTTSSGNLLELVKTGIMKFSVSRNGNVGINGTSFQNGVGVIFIADTTTVPTTNPVGGGLLYVEGGSLKYRGTTGVVTVLGV